VAFHARRFQQRRDLLVEERHLLLGERRVGGGGGGGHQQDNRDNQAEGGHVGTPREEADGSRQKGIVPTSDGMSQPIL
jgi:hypothetical protein